MVFTSSEPRSGTVSSPPEGSTASPSARWLRMTATALGLSGATAAVMSGMAGMILYRAARHRGVWGSGEPPESVVEDVEFSSTDGVHIRGWFLSADSGAPAPTLVMCHGVWTGRRECLPLGLTMRERGYNVLLFDFRAHGLSEGQYITVGHHEMYDVLGAVDYLQTRPDVDAQRIGIVGFSMGAASAIRAAAANPAIRAVVADSAYAAFVDAVRSSFRQVVHFPHYPFGPMALRMAKWLMRVDPQQLRPLDSIGLIAPRPVFIIHGEDDDIVPVRHASLLFKAAGEPKQLWVAPGAHHVGARDLYPDEYANRVDAFLRDALALVDSDDRARAA